MLADLPTNFRVPGEGGGLLGLGLALAVSGLVLASRSGLSDDTLA